MAIVGLAIAATAHAAAAERKARPMKYIFVDRHTILVGRSTSRASAIEVHDLDGLRHVAHGAGFGRSYPDRRLIVRRADPARAARHVLIIDADVDAERVADIVEMFEEPVALVVTDDHGARTLGVTLGRASDDDPSAIRARSRMSLSQVLAVVDVTMENDEPVSVTVRARHPRAGQWLQPRVRGGTPSLRAKVLTCYQLELFDDPSIRGELTLELDVTADGTVTGARAYGVPQVAPCAVRQARTLLFPAPPSGTATVMYALTLHP